MSEIEKFEAWWQKNYSYLNADGRKGLTRDITGMIKVVAKAAWMAALKEVK
jgi:hypothetical protein